MVLFNWLVISSIMEELSSQSLYKDELTKRIEISNSQFTRYINWLTSVKWIEIKKKISLSNKGREVYKKYKHYRF